MPKVIGRQPQRPADSPRADMETLSAVDRQIYAHRARLLALRLEDEAKPALATTALACVDELLALAVDAPAGRLSAIHDLIRRYLALCRPYLN